MKRWEEINKLQNTKDKIYFNFSYTALKLLGDGLYSNPWTAISELIANGIDANANKIYLYINMVEKHSSAIEIFDNGKGMTYSDLAEKYTLIGKKKRLDKDLDEDTKERVMGRKGIGKLAALYLASTYYIISKTEKQTSSWCLNMANVQDDDIPSIKKINSIHIESSTEWTNFKTGTLIKLIHVDLRNIGEQTLAGLKARIADYYAFNESNVNILVGLKQNDKENIVFERAEKQIAFKNFYAFFENTAGNIRNNLAKEILLRTVFPEKMPNTKKIKEATKDVYYKRCSVKILNNVFETSGEQKFIQENGKLSTKPYKYEMIGWIGVHSTIDKNDAKYNDKTFVRNKAYQPNRLRLYVRNKLAVENFMEYLHNTQTFGKYIEGEIHFDILDNNELPDIATAGRQSYKENNDRIQKLVEILKPIIGSLIKTRVEIGHRIRNEEEDFKKSKEAEQKAETEQAQAEAREAKDARDKAEKSRKNAEAHARDVEKELEQEKKQNIFQRSIIGHEKEQIIGLQHQIKHSASRIKKNVSNLYEYFIKSNKSLIDNFIIKYLSTISIESENIESIAKYITSANFDLKSTEIKEDIIRFIKEYINEIFIFLEKKAPKIFLVTKEGFEHIIEFRPLEVTSLIDNLIHNAQKAKATNINITFLGMKNKLEITIADNGIGIPEENKSKIFDFGFTTTDGSGIGLYMVKKAVENLKGRIEVASKEKEGTTFKIVL
ncbi:MAG: ATP-binding protein [Bacteroidales bacterium]|nr:ATP-binding protein [Bacteroidales bacterium]